MCHRSQTYPFSYAGHLRKPSIQALIHNLNRHYYSINISYTQNELEQKMLLNLHKKTWTTGLKVAKFDEHAAENEKTVENLLELAKKVSLLIAGAALDGLDRRVVQEGRGCGLELHRCFIF
jgi:hypothetical protein